MEKSIIDTLNAIKREFNTVNYDFGVATKNSKVDFVFEYGGGETIHCVSISCGCTDASCDGNRVTGKLSVGEPVEKNGLYTDGEEFYLRHKVGPEWAYKNVHTGVDEISPERVFMPVKAGQIRKGVTVYFRPEEEFFVINDDLIRRNNPDKPAISLTIEGWVLLDDIPKDIETDSNIAEIPAS